MWPWRRSVLAPSRLRSVGRIRIRRCTSIGPGHSLGRTWASCPGPACLVADVGVTTRRQRPGTPRSIRRDHLRVPTDFVESATTSCSTSYARGLGYGFIFLRYHTVRAHCWSCWKGCGPASRCSTYVPATACAIVSFTFALRVVTLALSLS